MFSIVCTVKIQVHNKPKNKKPNMVVTTVRLSSVDADSKIDTSSSFTIRLRQRSVMSVSSAVPTFVSFLNAFPNVPEGQNEIKFTFEDFGGGGVIFSVTVTIDPTVNWTVTTLTAEIQAQVIAGGEPTFTAAPDVSGYHIVFGIDVTRQFTVDAPETTMGDILGLMPLTQNPSGPSQSMTGFYKVNLVGPTTAYLYGRQLNEDFIDSENEGSKFNVLCAIPLSKNPYGTYTQWVPKDLESTRQYFNELGGRDVSRVDIRLRDENGTLLELNNTPLICVFRYTHA